jgi:hypothetical protein
MAFHDEWQVDGYREVLTNLTANASLRPGLTLARGTDLPA